MKYTALIASFLLLTGTLSAAPPVSAREEGAIETIHFRYLKPSQAAQKLKEGLLPSTSPGIAEITPNDGDNTLILSGTSASVQEMKTILHLLDVKPRQLEIKMRLIEVRVAPDGTSRDVVLQIPTVSTSNNQPVEVSVGAPNIQGMNLQVTPHINGDKSITFLTALTLRHLGSSGATARIQTAGLSTYLRVPRQGEWKRCVMGSLNGIEQPKAGDTSKSIRSADSLFRIEIRAVELK